MSILVRLVVGTLIGIHSYLLLTQPQERHSFHTNVDLAAGLCGHSLDYQQIETIRLSVISILFAAALQLVLQWGVKFSIFAQLLWIIVQNNLPRKADIVELQTVIFNALLLILLLKEHCSKCQDNNLVANKDDSSVKPIVGEQKSAKSSSVSNQKQQKDKKDNEESDDKDEQDATDSKKKSKQKKRKAK